jgi:HD-like signal output (HDOD) protein/signal transduction histidine kinase
LCARVLTVANSPALRRGREIRRIEDCLTVLGTRFVRTMAACLAVQSAFDEVARQIECDLSGFWLHSLEVAELARSIAVATRKANPEEAYLAGLLHDTGQLLLLTGVPDYTGLLVVASDEELLCELELSTLGAHHGAVGAWLVDKWQIDSFLADAILFHHEPATRAATGDALTRILWAAHSATLAAEAPPAEAAEVVTLDADTLASLRAESRQRTGGIAEALGISGGVGVGPLPQPTGMNAVAPNAATSPLADAARGMAYAQPLQESLFGVTSDEELLLTVRESARILFGLGRMCLLLSDAKGTLLTGSSGGDQPTVLRHMEIPMATSPSLAARSAIERKPICSIESGNDNLSLTDIQILRALGSEGLLCIPLAARQKCSGVMVFGVTEAQWPRVAKRLSWLTNFARIVATGIEASREAREREQATEAVLAGRFKQRARQVAHEAGNPLGIIRNYLKLLERRLADEGTVPRELAVLDQEITRVAKIIRDVGEAETESASAANTNLPALIESLLAGYKEPLFTAQGIELALDLPGEAVLVAAQREPLTQVLLNLWKNASEAMPNGGSYRISVVSGVIESGRRLVEIRLQDSGPGLPPELWERLVTGTAPPSSGPRGLGLGIVLELVATMSGRIACASQPGRGTLFSIHLPVAEA